MYLWKKINMRTYSIVMVTHISDLKLVKHHIPIIYYFLNPKDIIIISDKKAECEIKNMKLNYVKFIDENLMIPFLNFHSVEDVIKNRCLQTVRTGWYFQQFLKMAYAYICEDEWYLLWDIDTIPLRKINFFDKYGKGIFDIKTEYHKPYFQTMKKLLGINKGIYGSFISEHMLINKKIMLELLTKIEANKKLYGDIFFEKIISAVNVEYLKGCGFSEYETYGNFVVKNYSELYTYRKLKTLREGKILLKDSKNKKLLKWAKESYDIISFEKYHKTNFLFFACINKFLHHFMSMKDVWYIYKKIYTGEYYE